MAELEGRLREAEAKLAERERAEAETLLADKAKSVRKEGMLNEVKKEVRAEVCKAVPGP